MLGVGRIKICAMHEEVLKDLSAQAYLWLQLGLVQKCGEIGKLFPCSQQVGFAEGFGGCSHRTHGGAVIPGGAVQVMVLCLEIKYTLVIFSQVDYIRFHGGLVIKIIGLEG